MVWLAVLFLRYLGRVVVGDMVLLTVETDCYQENDERSPGGDAERHPDEHRMKKNAGFKEKTLEKKFLLLVI